MKHIGFLCAFLVFSVSAAGQKAEVSNPLDRLDFMLGEWQGTGWMTGQGGRTESDVWESIECKLDCRVFEVNGLGTMTDPNTGESKVTHEAFGVISYDPESETIQMRAYKEDAVTVSSIDFISDKVIRWGFEVPGGNVRFTTDFSTPNTWSEIGEFSRDGESWMQFLETTLTKVE